VLGERIKQARLEQGLSQRQLCGEEITRNMLSQIESGKARPSMQTLTYLAQALGKPVSFFLDEVVTPERAPLLEEARGLYSRGAHRECITLLESPEAREAAGEEGRLLLLMANLQMARKSLDEGRKFYARSLLEKMAATAENAFYYTPALERERLLLLYEAEADPRALAEGLPKDHREFLLLAEAALADRKFDKCKGLLSALGEETARYHLLMGQAEMGQGMFKEAIPHLQQAEADYPLPCAQALEVCFRELEDFKMAYIYACKQKPK